MDGFEESKDMNQLIIIRATLAAGLRIKCRWGRATARETQRNPLFQSREEVIVVWIKVEG